MYSTQLYRELGCRSATRMAYCHELYELYLLVSCYAHNKVSRFDCDMTPDTSFDRTDQCRIYCLSEIWGIVIFVRRASPQLDIASQRCRLNRFEQSRPNRERKTYKRTGFVSAPSRDISYLYRHSRLIMFSRLTPIVIALFAMAGVAVAQCQFACCTTPPAVGHDVLC